MARVPVSRQTLDWLLAEENPPVRYLTLTDLLGRSAASREVRQARSRLGEYGPTRRILRDRKRFWVDQTRPNQLYQKYRGGYWQLIFLGEFLAPRSLPGVEQGVELVLSKRRGPVGTGEHWGIHCLAANLLRAMVTLGYGRDRRVREGIEFLAQQVVESDGVPCFIIDWSLLPTCIMSTPKILLALTSLPPDQRTPTQRRAIRIGRDRLLENEVLRYVRSESREWYAYWPTSPAVPGVSAKPEKRAAVRAARAEWIAARGGLGERKEKAGWLHFGFPTNYNSDVLEALRALVRAGVPRRSPRVAGALRHVLERRLPDGTWCMEKSWNGKMIANVEHKGHRSRWLTYHALCVLSHFRGLELP